MCLSVSVGYLKNVERQNQLTEQQSLDRESKKDERKLTDGENAQTTML